MNDPVLEVRGLTKRFGGLVAVDSLELGVERGTITALIGPNGAGKTTFFNCIMGLLTPDEGSVTVDRRDITDLPTHERAHAGLGRTFQRLEVFSGMSVAENLQVAAEAATPGRVWRDLLRFTDREEPDIERKVRDLLHMMELEEVADTPAGDLPTGTLRIVELGRALCTDPKVLLLDEPASGLDSSETETFERLLRQIVESGTSVLLVEHDVELVLEVSDYVYVLDFGRKIAEGTPDMIVEDSAVQAAYLGVDENEEDLGAPAS